MDDVLKDDELEGELDPDIIDTDDDAEVDGALGKKKLLDDDVESLDDLADDEDEEEADSFEDEDAM